MQWKYRVKGLFCVKKKNSMNKFKRKNRVVEILLELGKREENET